ncbi:hypothetical protein HIM_02846 [Hirsutella minnesotensis 3608]|nr:hypothetical protein HIM_02846 [Hirsutella minnesotensis 3608]
MKFSAVTLACLATGAYSYIAEPPTKVYERDIATVTGAISAVGQGIDSLDSAVKGFSNDPQPVKDAADKLIATLKDSTTKVQGSDKLTLADALGLQDPVKSLQTKSEALVSELKARKQTIQKGGFCDLVRQQVNDISSNSDLLIKATVSKVPAEAQAIAENLAAGIKKVLGDANTEFNKDNCKSAPSSSAPAAPSSSSAPSAPSSSSAPSAPSSSAPSAPTGAPTSAAPTAQPSSPSTTGGAYPIPSAPNTTPYQPTGTGVPSYPGGQPPVVTAGASFVGPAGAFAMAVAALIL